MEIAEYADANNLLEEPVFKWWANKVLKKKDRIISRVKPRYWRTSHKLGISLPHSVEESYDIDEENGHIFWLDAIDKELKKILGMETFEMM